ncbi:hypothetical protein PGDDIFCJ_00047 [Thermus phage YS40_Isch]|nr:hypothetical protein PGDDIFCJ_00047 [Thermus phage YS40_Isch]
MDLSWVEELRKEREMIESEYASLGQKIQELEARRKMLRERAIYLEGVLDAVKKIQEDTQASETKQEGN